MQNVFIFLITGFIILSGILAVGPASITISLFNPNNLTIQPYLEYEDRYHYSLILGVILLQQITAIYLLPTLLTFPAWLVTFSLLVFTAQDLLTSYVTSDLAWGIFIIILGYLAITADITLFKFELLLITSIILCNLSHLGYLGSGDLPIILLLQLILSPFSFSLLLLIAATLSLVCFAFSKVSHLPFIPFLQAAFLIIITFF